MSPIEDRLAASLRFDALNGSSHERAVVTRQIREAIEELRSLRDDVPPGGHESAIALSLTVDEARTALIALRTDINGQRGSTCASYQLPVAERLHAALVKHGVYPRDSAFASFMEGK